MSQCVGNTWPQLKAHCYYTGHTYTVNNYPSVKFPGQDEICLDESKVLSMSCTCMDSFHKYRGMHGRGHNVDDQVYNV